MWRHFKPKNRPDSIDYSKKKSIRWRGFLISLRIPWKTCPMLPLLLHRDIIFETILVHSNPECFLWDRMIIKSYKTPHCNYANKRNICSKIDKIQSIVVQKLRFIAQKAFFFYAYINSGWQLHYCLTIIISPRTTSFLSKKEYYACFSWWCVMAHVSFSLIQKALLSPTAAFLVFHGWIQCDVAKCREKNWKIYEFVY